MGDKPRLSVAFCGTQGCGKTTALAHLCNQLGSFDEGRHKTCKDLSREFGRKPREHAWMLDTLAEERERGVTVQPSLTTFSSDKFQYAAIDTPGSPELTKNMITAMSMADIAAIVVSAAPGDMEAGVESGSIKETILTCFTMGVKNVVVLITKMDEFSIAYNQAKFDEIKKTVSGYLKEVGYKQKDPPFVPVSGIAGDNLAAKSCETEWYAGASVVDALDALGASVNRPDEKPLRIPVLKVSAVKGAGVTVTGRVETGSVRVGNKVIFSPGGKTSEVKSIHVGGSDVREGGSGDIVSLAFSDIIAADLHRGMVASSVSEDTAVAVESLVAQIVLLDCPNVMREGYCPSISIHTAQVQCEFEEFLAKIDRKTGKEESEKPVTAKSGEVITARLRPRSQVCAETFATFPSLGRFAVRDHNRTIAVGIVKEVTKRPVPKIRCLSMDSDDDDED